MVSERRNAFVNSEFYGLIVEGTDESLSQALEHIASGAVDVSLRGNSPKSGSDASTNVRESSDAPEEELEKEEQTSQTEDDNWTYLHLVVDR
jgi:hypothetical protein